MNGFLKYLTLFLMAMPSAQAVLVEGGEIMLRLLLNGGDEDSHKVCTDTETYLIRNTLIDHVAGTSNDRRELQPVNCPRLCCNFDWHMCHQLNPRCAGYPTPSSNRQGCRRLSESEGDHGFVILEDVWYGADAKGGRSLESADWQMICLQQKRAAMTALMGIVEDLTSACESLALSPTVLNCVFIPDE